MENKPPASFIENGKLLANDSELHACIEQSVAFRLKPFVKQNMEHLKVLAKWCDVHGVSFSGHETSVILSVVDELIKNETD